MASKYIFTENGYVLTNPFEYRGDSLITFNNETSMIKYMDLLISNESFKTSFKTIFNKINNVENIQQRYRLLELLLDEVENLNASNEKSILIGAAYCLTTINFGSEYDTKSLDLNAKFLDKIKDDTRCIRKYLRHILNDMDVILENDNTPEVFKYLITIIKNPTVLLNGLEYKPIIDQTIYSYLHDYKKISKDDMRSLITIYHENNATNILTKNFRNYIFQFNELIKLDICKIFSTNDVIKKEEIQAIIEKSNLTLFTEPELNIIERKIRNDPDLMNLLKMKLIKDSV